MSIAIKVENVSKQYRLGKVGTGTLSHDLNRWWHLVRGREDPYLKIGETNNRTIKGESDYIWALRDINFEIEQGSAVGIIGRNGAGKSTLLKILSRTTAPTTGNIRLRGRVASLLEVGTGFHPELSGRENIYLNGAILGMTRHEILRKFDEIVDFSGVERYIDTPVKRYSSGMYVRLAFAVAAHLESEILIVDEVLAVGDAEFQKKCLGKMGDVSRAEGRTVLFVSHNLQAVKNLCSSTILMNQGMIEEIGMTYNTVETYLKLKQSTALSVYNNLYSDKPIYLKHAVIKKIDGTLSDLFNADDDIYVELTLVKNAPIRGAYLHLTIVNSDALTIVETDTIEQNSNEIDTSETGTFVSIIIISRRLLNNGRYYLNLGIASSQAENFQIESLESFITFSIVADTTRRDLLRKSILSSIPQWTTNLID
jgi:lipopolysaccharide transport system ATP-binding protein